MAVITSRMLKGSGLTLEEFAAVVADQKPDELVVLIQTTEDTPPPIGMLPNGKRDPDYKGVWHDYVGGVWAPAPHLAPDYKGPPGNAPARPLQGARLPDWMVDDTVAPPEPVGAPEGLVQEPHQGAVLAPGAGPRTLPELQAEAAAVGVDITETSGGTFIVSYRPPRRGSGKAIGLPMLAAFIDKLVAESLVQAPAAGVTLEPTT